MRDKAPPLVDQVVALLSADLGETMARAAVKVHLQKAGISLESFRVTHLPDLAERLRPGLKVFLGAAKADLIASQVQNLGRRKP